MSEDFCISPQQRLELIRNYLHLKKVVSKMPIFRVDSPENKKEV